MFVNQDEGEKWGKVRRHGYQDIGFTFLDVAIECGYKFYSR